MGSILETAWITFKDGPQAAAAYSLYNSTSWVGLQIVDLTLSCGSSFIDFFAHMPDQLTKKFMLQDNSSNYFYNKILDVSTPLAEQANKLHTSALNCFAPKAETAQFGFSELVGPVFTWYVVTGLALENLAKTFDRLLFSNEQTRQYVIKNKNVKVCDHQNYSGAKLARETTISAIVTAALGFTSYLIGNGIHNRLDEVGFSENQQMALLSGGLALAIGPSLYHWYATRPKAIAKQTDTQASENTYQNPIFTNTPVYSLDPKTQQSIMDFNGQRVIFNNNGTITISSEPIFEYSYTSATNVD